MSVSTEEFHPRCENWFKSWHTVRSLFSECCVNPKKEHVFVSNTIHMYQSDMAVISPLELFILTKSRPTLTTVSSYHLMSQLWLSFLERLNFKRPEVDFLDVDRTINRMAKNWLTYEQTLAVEEPYSIDIEA